jgi:hypothetical protein
VATLSTGAYKLRTLSYITIVLSLFLLFSSLIQVDGGLLCSLAHPIVFLTPDSPPLHPACSHILFWCPTMRAKLDYLKYYLRNGIGSPIRSSIVKIIPVIVYSLSGLVVRVIKIMTACLNRSKFLKPTHDGY